MATIASSATSVLIAHVAAQTRDDPPRGRRDHAPEPRPARRSPSSSARSRRCIPGGSTSASGGRPGSDQNTMRALRRDADVGRPLPRGRPRAPGLPRRRDPRSRAWTRRPGKGTNVPLYILGSSMFGASSRRRSGCRMPSPRTSRRTRCSRPSRPTGASSARPRSSTRPTSSPASTSSPRTPAPRRRSSSSRQAQPRGRRCSAAGRRFTDDEADAILASPAGQHVQQMSTYAAVGTPAEVSEYIEAFAKHADADELIVAHQSPTAAGRLRSVELLMRAG